MPKNNSKARRLARRDAAATRLRRLAEALTKTGHNKDAQEVFKEAVRIEGLPR